MSVDLSLMSLFTNASPLVKSVMLLLFVISVTSWTLIFQRAKFLKEMKRLLTQFEERFHLTGDLDKLYEYIAGRRPENHGVENVIRAGFREFLKFRQQPSIEPKIAIQGAERAMQVALAKEEDELEKHLSFLANVGSISVYVGLFGTVWGIMTAFRALAHVQQASIAMVAPGISEALVATALGLFAAIPAVFAYNRFRSQVESLMRQYDNLSEEFFNLLHRHLYTEH